ncbi:MAG: hypothetical protein JSV37_02055 [Anaerolineaceae bacterium]|nr:MAG: hypothetical protein JSV37_02055 [Anaerolineaceae bacterium]
MRGKRVSRASRKLDVVLVAARYGEGGDQLDIVQGYERRGFVWGDLVLLDRQALIERLNDKKRVVTGYPGELPGDFEVTAEVHLTKEGGGISIVADGHQTGVDDLGLPLF